MSRSWRAMSMGLFPPCHGSRSSMSARSAAESLFIALRPACFPWRKSSRLAQMGNEYLLVPDGHCAEKRGHQARCRCHCFLPPSSLLRGLPRIARPFCPPIDAPDHPLSVRRETERSVLDRHSPDARSANMILRLTGVPSQRNLITVAAVGGQIVGSPGYQGCS
jgi:hypothetical protein